ncbi:flagellar basal-body rod modification protein FlgD [Melghiribacillus thermohalophilus]|uniref:Flagellar basal-body rod modification protein FlgD n=1 Tax=Melghiribacillus thermohalophilus TaxID=1324956 RepID=A0A4R3NH25_9BACI|nr:flagellar hook assembly protein FlgD [Melghiribacillus thermohalophilus]TCT26768.1 flagellar basal-body rod modification protein FlgD [Melghiribacillus thermohalophilus]
MTRIDPSFYLSNQVETGGNSNLGKEEFLKILMAQLENQDPLNPMEDKDFIAQMATFSQLEQLMNISNSMEMFNQFQTYRSVVEYSHLIEKEVTYQTYDSEGNPDGTEKGIVQRVSMADGSIKLVLDSGDEVDVTDVTEISLRTDQTP